MERHCRQILIDTLHNSQLLENLRSYLYLPDAFVCVVQEESRFCNIRKCIFIYDQEFKDKDLLENRKKQLGDIHNLTAGGVC